MWNFIRVLIFFYTNLLSGLNKNYIISHHNMYVKTKRSQLEILTFSKLNWNLYIFQEKIRVKPYCVCKERVRTQNAPQKCVCTCIGWAGYRSWGYSCRRHTCSLFVCTAGEWVSLRVWPQSPSCVACIWKKIITLIFFSASVCRTLLLHIGSTLKYFF